MPHLDHTAVRLAFRKVLLRTPNLPPTDRWSIQNVKFTPPNPPTIWLRETFLPGDESKGSDSIYTTVGIYQMDVYGPLGGNTDDVEDTAKTIADAFPDPMDLQVGPAQISVYRTTRKAFQESVGTRVQRDLWVFVPVQMLWRAFCPA